MRIYLATLLLALGVSSPAWAQDKPPSVVIYPILVQAPIYGATVDVPSIPGGGGGAEGGGATTDWGFNAAYMGGMELHGNRVFAETDLFWTKPSASRDVTPRIDVSTELWVVGLKGGYRVYKGLGVTAGTRYISLNTNTSLEFPQSGVTLTGSSKQTRWLPFVGGDWRGLLARKWTMNLSGDFGVGGDHTSSTRLKARVDWQLVPHVSIRVGYQLLHLKLDADAILGGVARSWSTSQSLHGPEFGLGIVF